MQEGTYQRHLKRFGTGKEVDKLPGIANHVKRIEKGILMVRDEDNRLVSGYVVSSGDGTFIMELM